MKNLFYHFLLTAQPADMVTKNGYLMIELKNPKITQNIQINDKNLSFISHHLRVSEHYEEGTGPLSLYHYTAQFTGHSVHIYGDINGNYSEIYYTEIDDEYKSTTNILPQKMIPIIKQLMDDYGLPISQYWIEQYQLQGKNLADNYNQEIARINQFLYDNNADVEHCRHTLQALIETGQELNARFNNKYKYSQRNLKAKLDALEASQNRRMLNVDTATTPPTPATEQEDVLGSIPTLEQHAQTHQEVAYNTYIDFQDQYKHFKKQVDNLKGAKGIESKVAHIEEIDRLLPSLRFEADQLLDTQIRYLDNSKKTKVLETCAELEQLSTEFKQIATKLLSIIIHAQDLNRLRLYGSRLQAHAADLPQTQIQTVLKNGSLEFLLYLLNHSPIKVNFYHLQVNEHSSETISLLAASYHYQQLECFIALLKRGANVFTRFEEEMPLAYTLETLEHVNPYRKALHEHSNYFPARQNQFFSNLASIVENRLNSDLNLTPETRDKLTNELELFRASTASSNIPLSNRSTVRTTQQISQHVDPEVMTELKLNPHYRRKLKEQMDLSARVIKEMERQRLGRRFKGLISIDLKDLNALISENQYIQEQMKGIKIEQILDLMDTNISRLEDFLTLAKNAKKFASLNKHQKKEVLDAQQRINDYTEQQARSQRAIGEIPSLNELMSNLEKIKQAFETLSIEGEDAIFSNFINTIINKLTPDSSSANNSLGLFSNSTESEQKEEDEFPGLDFEAAAEENPSQPSFPISQRVEEIKEDEIPTKGINTIVNQSSSDISSPYRLFTHLPEKEQDEDKFPSLKVDLATAGKSSYPPPPSVANREDEDSNKMIFR